MTTPSTPEALTELLTKMTPGKWETVPYADLSYSRNVAIYSGGRLLITTMYNDAPGIAALVNLSTELCELWRAARNMQGHAGNCNYAHNEPACTCGYRQLYNTLTCLAKGEDNEPKS